MASRKEVKDLLARHGITHKFSLKTISFSDLAREDVQECTIKVPLYGVKPDWAVYNEAKQELKKMRVIMNVACVQE